MVEKDTNINTNNELTILDKNNNSDNVLSIVNDINDINSFLYSVITISSMKSDCQLLFINQITNKFNRDNFLIDNNSIYEDISKLLSKNNNLTNKKIIKKKITNEYKQNFIASVSSDIINEYSNKSFLFNNPITFLNLLFLFINNSKHFNSVFIKYSFEYNLLYSLIYIISFNCKNIYKTQNESNLNNNNNNINNNSYNSDSKVQINKNFNIKYINININFIVLFCYVFDINIFCFLFLVDTVLNSLKPDTKYNDIDLNCINFNFYEIIKLKNLDVNDIIIEK